MEASLRTDRPAAVGRLYCPLGAAAVGAATVYVCLSVCLSVCRLGSHGSGRGGSVTMGVEAVV